MIQSTGDRMIGLLTVAIIAVGTVLFLLWQGSRKPGRNELLLGYPPALFPAQELTRSGALAALAATQARLAAIYGQMPQQSEMAIWLSAFLGELRQIMDTAYRVALVMQVYGRPAPLERLVAELQQIEVEVAEHVAQRLLARDGDAHSELLDGRLATLRMCVRELASLAAAGSAG